MRSLADATRIRAVMYTLGQESRDQARVYSTSEATAVLPAWREESSRLHVEFASPQPRRFRLPAVDPPLFADAVAAAISRATLSRPS